MDALNILEEPIYDNTIESLQYVSYSPQSQQNLDNNGTPITIDIQGSDAYLLPCKSFIVIKGQLVKSADDTVFAATDKIALVNNAMMFLFKEVVYTINDQIVERINNPGQITSMMRYLSMPDDYSTGAALKSCWTKDTTTMENTSNLPHLLKHQLQVMHLKKILTIIKALQLEGLY